MEGTLRLQIGSDNVDSGNITHSYNNNYITVIKTDEYNEIKQWLSPLTLQSRHQSVQASRVEGVGSWLLEKKEFQEWISSQGAPKQAVLFCYGDPGVGKTHISSLVIDSLYKQVRKQNIAVAGLYCDYLAQEQLSATNMLGAILKQLFPRNRIPEPVRQAFHDEKSVQLSDLVEILKTTIALLPGVFICIDALDECLPKDRLRLLDSLQEIVSASPATRVFLTGRPHVRDEIKRYFPEAIMIPVIPTIEDIERYLNMRLGEDATPSAMDSNLRAEIMRVIPRKISGIFLLVSLNIDAVLEEVTIYQRKKKLDEMIQGNGLRDAYSATLSRIKAQARNKSRLGMDMLMWLSHSERPLKTNELCDALGVEIESADRNSQNIPAIETLLGCSLGLVVVEASSYTVRLVHYTLQEYLSNNADLFPSPHAAIAQVCLTYLNFRCIRDLPPMHQVSSSLQETALLDYASCYWGIHARMDFTERVNELTLGLLDGFDKHVSSGILLSHRRHNWDGSLYRSMSTGFTGLHGAAYLGMAEAAAGLLKMKKWDLGTTDWGGNTAILWAVRRGLRAMVEMLLTRGDASPNTADKGGETPLHRAVADKSTDIVKMLLKRRDISPNITDKYGRTPLSWAAGNGNDDLVRMLLGREAIIPDAADKDGQTPLSWAAANGRHSIMKMLLKRRDVSPNITDKYGRTPLSWAAGSGNEDIVKMLLERGGVAPEAPHKNGQTPLSWAAERGHIRVVEILLEKCSVSQDVLKTDLACQTALTQVPGKQPRGVMKRRFGD